MPFPMKVQPFDPGSASSSPLAAAAADNSLPVVVLKPLPPKSRLKRLLERQFRAVPAAVTAAVAAAPPRSSSSPVVVPVRVPLPGDSKDNDNTEAGGAAAADPEPSSLCLSKMVHNFLEGNNDKPARCGRRRCSCFNGSTDDSSDDEFDSCGEQHPPPSEVSEIVKSLVSCTGVPEKNLLAEVCKIVERTRLRSDKVDDASRRRKMVVDGLVALGYDASVCKSRWEKSASIPDGEYDYIDVVLLDGVKSSGCVAETDRRVLVDIDFRSEFEIARSTKRYRAVLQSLPAVFVGRAERLQQIVAVVSEAARQSLKKRGLHVPPWRKSEYMKAKWLSPYQRLRSTTPAAAATPADSADASTKLIHNADAYAPKEVEEGESVTVIGSSHNITKKLGGNCDGVGNVAGDLNTASTDGDRLPTKPSEPVGFLPVVPGKEEDEKKPRCVLEVRVEEGMEASASEWQPPAVTPKARTPKGARVVTGLTSMILAETGNVGG